MACVGTALTGLAFVIYKHRASISVPAVAGTALLSSVFSVAATLGASNILGVTAGAACGRGDLHGHTPPGLLVFWH